MKKSKLIVDVTLISVFSAILIAQTFALSMLPNIQLTFLFLFICVKHFGVKKTGLIFIIYLLVINSILGGFNLIYFPFQLIAYLAVILMVKFFIMQTNNNIILAFLSIIMAIFYCLVFAIPSVLILEIDFLVYLVSDLIFMMFLALSSFLSVLLFYPVSEKNLGKLLLRLNRNDENLLSTDGGDE